VQNGSKSAIAALLNQRQAYQGFHYRKFCKSWIGDEMNERRLEFRPQAQDELLDAIDWYAERDPRVADRFDEAIRLILNRIQNSPMLFPAVESEPTLRIALVGHFPYYIVFRPIGEDAAEVIAVAHAKREPGYWKHRTES